MAQKKFPQKATSMLETICGCKWSLTVYSLLRSGINRPGKMVRSVEGLSTKVLNECLRKNIELGILEKKIFNTLPPKVEYVITPLGERFLKILEQIEELNQHILANKLQQ